MRSRVGRVMAVLGVPMLLGPIADPILGGWLIDAASWHWIFLINVPIGSASRDAGIRPCRKAGHRLLRDLPNPGRATTLPNMLVGLLPASEGQLRVVGAQPSSKPKFLPRVGFLAQDCPLYKEFTVADLLRFGRSMNHLRRGTGEPAIGGTSLCPSPEGDPPAGIGGNGTITWWLAKRTTCWTISRRRRASASTHYRTCSTHRRSST